MKRCKNLLFIALLTMFGSLLQKSQIKIEVNKVEAADYYDTITDNATGSYLRAQLYDLMMKTHKTYTSYDGLKSAYKTTDVDPNNPANVLLCYTGTSRTYNNMANNINREHVWPNSKGVGKSGPGSDAHHLRPCDLSLNSSRGNLDFDEVSNGRYASENGITTQNKVGSNAFEPQDSAKGNIARIIFYVGMHYGPDSSYNLTIVDTIGNGKGKSIGKLSTLLKWNLEHPVGMDERRRNEAAQVIQGNRNPFIDHPEFACKIWGDYNENTRLACAQGGQTPDNPQNPKETIEADAKDIKNVYNKLFNEPIKEMTQIKINGTYGSKITWESSNPSLLNINNQTGTVTLNPKDKNEHVTLTATLTYQEETMQVVFEVTIKHNLTIPSSFKILKENDGSGEVKQETYEYMFTQRQNSGTLQLGSILWEHTRENETAYTGYDGNKGYQMGSSNNPGGGSFITSDLKDYKIKTIEITAAVASQGKTDLEVLIDHQSLGVKQPDVNPQVYLFENQLEVKGDVTIAFKVTAKASYIKNIRIEYESGVKDEEEKTYASISLKNPSMRFGISLSKDSIANTLKLEKNAIDYTQIQLKVMAVENEILTQYGYESMLELNASSYQQLIKQSPLLNYMNSQNEYNVSLVLYSIDMYEEYNAICYFEYENNVYYSNEITTSYYEMAELNYERYLSLKQDMVQNGNYQNEYEEELNLLSSILN